MKKLISRIDVQGVRRLLTVSGLGLLVVAGTYGGGVATGWYLADRQAAERPSDSTTEVVEIEVPAFDTADAVMPDVRGLDRETAFQVLVDAGVPRDTVSVESRPAAGTPGVVIEQEPAFGTADPANARVVISTEAVVPEAVGRPDEDVLAELEELGVQVDLAYRYVPGETPGTVLSTSSEEGEPLPAQLTVEVAAAPSSVFIAELDPVEGGCREDTAMVDGRAYDVSLRCSVGVDPRESAWVLGRTAESVSGTVGVPDDADPDVSVSVEVVADGDVLETVTAGYGEPSELDVSVVDVLRLTLRLSLVEAEDGPARGEVVLGDLRLVGEAEALDALIEGSR